MKHLFLVPDIYFQITLMILSVLCCGAIGVGLFGNDDLHNAMLQSIQAGNQLAALVNTVKNQVLNIHFMIVSAKVV